MLQLHPSIKPRTVGKGRVQASLARVAPQQVRSHSLALLPHRHITCSPPAHLILARASYQVKKRHHYVQLRVTRQPYHAPYYGYADHIDLNCKLTIGNIIIYIYGQV